MRILVVTQYFWPENFRVNDLVSDWIWRGHEVTVLTGYPNYPEGRIYPDFAANPSQFGDYCGAKVIRVPILPRGNTNFRMVLNYLSFVVSGLVMGSLKLRRLRFDVIFVFQTSPITAALPALWLRLVKRAPMVMWILDLWPESISAVGAVGSKLVLRWVARLVTFIYHNCDRILVQSRAFMPNVQGHGGDPEQIRYFPNWAEPTFQGRLDDVEVAPELVPHLGAFNILYAGNIGFAQDFPAILAAVEVLRERKDIRWLILGDGRVADWVRSEIKGRGLEDNVKLLGAYPLDRMPSFFKGAQALLMTLRQEPIFALTVPGKVQSYMASSLPILGMLDGEGARIILEAGAGLVCPAGQGELLAEQVRRMAEMKPAEREAMGERGRHYNAREFNRESLLNALESWLTDFQGKGGTAAS